MSKQPIANAVTALYAVVQIAFFGALVSETILIYPNVFRDVPRSLDAAQNFMQVTDPGSIFPPIGAVAILIGLVSLLLMWGWRPVRYGLIASLVAFVAGNMVFSIAFAWPRNVILFEEGAAVHPVWYLEQTAQEFSTGHWVRIVSSLLAGALAGAAFVAGYRRRLLTSPGEASMSRLSRRP